jgi:hypothetical protein
MIKILKSNNARIKAERIQFSVSPKASISRLIIALKVKIDQLLLGREYINANISL